LAKRQKYRPLPLSELAICQRVREERTGTLLGQPIFAHSIGLSRDQLASIETGRVPVRAEVGIRLCRELDINPLWLAFGDEFEQPRWIEFRFMIPRTRSLFSEVVANHRDDYATFRDVTFEREQPLLFKETREFRGLTDEQKAILVLLEKWQIRIVPEDYWALARHLRRAADAFDLVKGALTQHAKERMLLRMKPPAGSSWANLRRRLISATRTTGAQTALADHLGITRQAVSEWVRRDDRAPEADTTLRLLDWVAAEEAKSKQKKRAGSAETRPALKTRKSKSTSHEKAKSDQRKE
jgi:transcriptional regulator with XRE-family HTH domain